MSSDHLALGIRDLDDLLQGIPRGALVVIAGYPGSGKSTLASSICYENARRGSVCLYFSTSEDKEKLYRFLSPLGINLAELEEQGLVRFVELPVVPEPEKLGEILVLLKKALEEFKPGVVVIDTLTPIQKAAELSRRASEFYEFLRRLPGRINGSLIVTVEVPLSAEKPELGPLEYISDLILLLGRRDHRGVLVREVEVVKARGTSVPFTRVSFEIPRAQALSVWAPPMPEDIPAPRRDKGFRFGCSAIDEYIENLYGGQSVLSTYQPDARPYLMPLLLISLALNSNARVLLISYKYSPQEIYEFYEPYAYPKLRRLGVEKGIEPQELRSLLEDIIVVESINPAVSSLESIYMRELKKIYEVKPDIVVFNGVDLLYSLYSKGEAEYFNLLMAQYYHLKKLGILVVRDMALIDEKFYKISSTLADVIFRFEYVESRARGYEGRLRIWRRGKEPRILGMEDMSSCEAEAVNAVARHLKFRTGRASG